MLAFRDTTAEVREPKSARLEQRTKPKVKEVIERAASTLGVDTSDFVISAAYKEAMSTLEAYSRTSLTREATAAFFAAIDNVSGANEHMLELMKDYDSNVGNAIK
jgi:uncharacterized protein (DUF1778 family)